MLDTELYALLERTADAAYCVTESGEVCAWNRAAEALFGYAASEVAGRNVHDVLEARDTLGTEALAGGRTAAIRRSTTPTGGIPSFDLQVRTRAGAWIWVNVSTILFDNRRTGRRLIARLARDVTHHRKQEELLQRMIQLSRQLVSLADDDADLAPVEALTEQERRVLSLFAEGRTAASIAARLRISPQTLRNHLHHVNRKLRTHSRVEAVTHALRRGLLD
jgi:PAS domain S-box-containing protein